jgi:hypothetical protein
MFAEISARMGGTLFTYLRLGWEHIVSADALDHQLFLVALLWPFSFKLIRKALILITAFTIGHCLTLALSSMGAIRIPGTIIEFLIPASIFITALLQLFGSVEKKGNTTLFGVTGLFGLLHGLGFAGTLNSLLGKEDSLLLPLFGFNTGVEAGQLFLVVLILCIRGITSRLGENFEKITGRLVLGAVLSGSLWIMWNRIPF